MTTEFKKGYYTIEDSQGNKIVVYPRTIPECVKIPTEGDENQTLQDFLNKVKSAAYKDVNEIIDPTSSITEGTASTERTYCMKAINQGFTDIGTEIANIKTSISKINDPTEEFNDIKKKFNTLQISVSNLQKIVTDYTKNVTTIQKSQSALINENTQLESKVSDLMNRVSALESK